MDYVYIFYLYKLYLRSICRMVSSYNWCSGTWKKTGIILLICTALIVFKKRHNSSDTQNDQIVLLHPPDDVVEPLPPSSSALEEFRDAAVITNAAPCADIAKAILLEGGKAVDAMIAAMLCDGVTMPQNVGLGGGFFMVTYDRKLQRSYVINARETAPFGATVDMYRKNSSISRIGGLSIAVPGELKGYWEVYNRFGGGIPWRMIFNPIIKLCESGIPINKNLERVLVRYESTVRNNIHLRKLFVNSKSGQLLKVGDRYTNPQLVKTLRIISEEGGNALYTGSLAKSLVRDIRNNGGIITLQDLANYRVRIEEPIHSSILNDKYQLHTVGPPASGVILSFILKVLDGLLPAGSELLNTHRITEAFKFGYGARSNLGDPYFTDTRKIMEKLTSAKFVDRIRKCIDDSRTYNDVSHYGGHYISEDHGTAAMSVIAKNGDAVSATSTINLIFGSKVFSPSTGIILNNEMDDFSSPYGANYFGVEPSIANFIAPEKRPLSSMCPTVITDSAGNVKMTIGASGGIYITSSVALTILRALVFNMTIKEAIDTPMYHHQLMPMVWNYWYGMLKSTVDGMRTLGHNTSRVSAYDYACVNAIYRTGPEKLTANTDYRRPGSIAGY